MGVFLGGGVQRQACTPPLPMPPPPAQGRRFPPTPGGGGLSPSDGGMDTTPDQPLTGAQGEYPHRARTAGRWSTGRGVVDGTWWPLRRYHSPCLALDERVYGTTPVPAPRAHRGRYSPILCGVHGRSVACCRSPKNLGHTLTCLDAAGAMRMM